MAVVWSGGPKQKKRSAAKINAVAAANLTNPKQSIRGLARHHQMSELIICRLVKEDPSLYNK